MFGDFPPKQVKGDMIQKNTLKRMCLFYCIERTGSIVLSPWDKPVSCSMQMSRLGRAPGTQKASRYDYWSLMVLHPQTTTASEGPTSRPAPGLITPGCGQRHEASVSRSLTSPAWKKNQLCDAATHENPLAGLNDFI